MNGIILRLQIKAQPNLYNASDMAQWPKPASSPYNKNESFAFKGKNQVATYLFALEIYKI